MQILTNLVRFGGAGAVFPFLFVVLLICTIEPVLPVDENVLNFDDEPVSEFLKKKKHYNKGKKYFHHVTLKECMFL